MDIFPRVVLRRIYIFLDLRYNAYVEGVYVNKTRRIKINDSSMISITIGL